ncbi:thiamine phosphate synthase [Synechococcus sp. CS-1332]|uniref:thiamine phosphate synthase n=1 Tax=Synechococcus sp. CS-1332 TaxID=2847972 RepID=UPI00223BFB72|nr:thiamine phosphate synthase [Synechococcus sp. CS-1332]MCT0208562.1 thiamine phosphate synthase [Synechococcus sp. CS-1332]
MTPQPPVPPSTTGNERAAIERLLDANLDRAREGLRVLEDWARFALDRPDLVARSKDLRQRLGRLHQERYKLARHTATDPAAGMSHPAQAERQDGASVLAANAGRVQEALRVLEEFGRLEDPVLAAEAATIRYALYDLEVDLLQAGRGGDERRALLRRCHVYLVTSPVSGLEAVVAAALAAGVRLVQYRAKPDDALGSAGAAPNDRGRFAQASALRQLCHRHGALFLVNDRIDLALAVGADGVHLGQGDLPPAVARRLLGPDRLIGRSTHGLADLRQAVADGCDYIGVGPVNATPTKPGREPVGLAYVAQAAAACPLPFFAIGGIDLTNLAAVREAGADRVAVVRVITQAKDPGAVAAALLAGLEAVA